MSRIFRAELNRAAGPGDVARAKERSFDRLQRSASELQQISGSWVVTPGVSWGFVLGVLVGFLPAFAVV
jgi:hypothetical protein